MKHPYTLILISLFLFPAYSSLTSQTGYGTQLIQKDYSAMLEKSAALEDTIDYYYRAYALDQTGDVAEAINTLELGIDRFGSIPEFEIELANLYYRMGRYASAKPLLYKYQELNEVFMKLIRVLEFESDYTQAIALLEERIITDSTNLDYLIRLADNYLAADRILSARDTYSKVIELNPRDIVSMSKLANIYLITMVYQASIELCDRALSIDSLNRTILKIRGLSGFRKGDFDLAERSFQQLMDMGDSSLVILKHLGISESKLYNFDDSREHLLMAYDKDTTDYEICFFLGRSYNYSSEPEKGLVYFDLADTLIQPSPAIMAAILDEKASLYYTLKDYKNALQCYEEAYAVKDNPEYLFFMGSLYRYQFRDPKKALELYEQFLAELDRIKQESQGPTRSQHISLKGTAERGVAELKEELFFTGELKE